MSPGLHAQPTAPPALGGGRPAQGRRSHCMDDKTDRGIACAGSSGAAQAAQRLRGARLSHVVRAGPRYGHGYPSHPELARILGRHEGAYREALRIIVRYSDDLRMIERHARDTIELLWTNNMLPGLDSAAIYAFLREWRPRRYIEIGSGNSTRFAARAKRDGN